MGYRLTTENLNDLIKEWKKEYLVYAPKLFKGNGAFSDTDRICYGEVTEAEEIVFESKSHYSFKEVLLPISQTLFFFTEENIKEADMPKKGAVIGISEDTVDLTIRRVGKVTNEVFEHYEGDKLFLRGPYGNGFDIENYKGKEIVIIAGGTGVSSVRGVVDYFSKHIDETKGVTLITGSKTPKDILFLKDFKEWKKNINVILTVDSADGDNTYPEGLVTKYIPELKLKNVSEAVSIVVGPPAMMRFSTQGLLDLGFKEENIWISQERKMCCGLGKCGHCKIDDVYVCLDGPVFNFTKGRKLID